MKINTKIRYGLRAMIEIGSNLKESGVLQKEIAQKQEIPLMYLDSIITGLKNAGLILNFAGKSSGYVLSRNPEDIAVYDIYRAFEPELALVNCSCTTNECRSSNTCPEKDYWFELNNQIRDLMKNSTLGQLIQNKVN